MNKYEIEYSKFLSDISQKVAEFIKNAYYTQDINKNSVYFEKSQNNNLPAITEQTQEIIDNETFTNVDMDKVEFVDFNKNKTNKTILYIIGVIVLYNLLRGK